MKTRSRPAFTLIELLVVIAIIALLVAILLPSLSKAKGVAKITKDSAAAKQLQQGWANYATDNKDKAVPGYKHWNWAHTHSSYGGLWLLNKERFLMAGTNMKPWPNQLWPYFDWDMRALLTDSTLFDNYDKRPRFVNPNNLPDQSVPSNMYEAAHNNNPSFGYNTDFVGGNFLRGAFYEFRGTPGTAYATSSDNNRPIKRKWYIQSTTDFRNSPSSLMVFTTARGPDISTSLTIPAYYDVVAPSAPRGFGASVGTDWSTWAQRRPFNPTAAPVDYGYVDCRYINQRSISAFADGHVEALGIDAYYDMRMWSTWANSSTWRWDATTRAQFVIP